MTQRVTVERATSPGTDDWGNPQPVTWATLTAALPCWLWSTLRRELIGPDATKVVEDLRAIVPAGTDVRESDRLRDVVEQSGTVYRAGVMRIESVATHRDHLELSLRAIESTGG